MWTQSHPTKNNNNKKKYLRERTDQKEIEYDRRIQKDKEEKTRGYCKIQTTVRDSSSRRRQMCELL
jgi:hypothetical protein